MLWEVVSSASCWAIRPRSAVCNPMKGETGTSGLHVHQPAAAGLGFFSGDAQQVVEEGQFLAHQGAVDAVLAGDLGEQAAQFGGAGEEAVLLGGRGEPGEGRQADL